MTASAVSARPISLCRPLAAITREASCGLSPKAMMFEVRRRTGRSTMLHSAAHSTQVTTAAMVREMFRKLCETRHNASIRGVSSNVTSIAAWSGGAEEPSFTIVPGAAKSAWNVASMPSK